MLWMTLPVLLAGALGWVAVVMIRYSREHKAVRAVANALSETELDQILDLIEQIATAPRRGYIGLFRDLWQPNGRLTIALPCDLADFPWGGKAVEVVAAPRRTEPPVTFNVHERSAHAQGCDEPAVRWLAVPTIRMGQQNRVQNVFSLDRYIKLSPALRNKLNDLHPKNPKKLLAQILSVDRRYASLEPFD
jgi:hypothetical protein